MTGIFTINKTDNARWLVLLRLGVGLLLIVKIFSEYGSLDWLYSGGGLVPVDISFFSQHPLIPSLHSIYILISIYCSEIFFLKVFFFLQLAAAGLLILGYKTPWVALVCWLMQVVIFNSTHLTSYGFDAMLLSLLFYAFIFPTGRYFSLDNNIRPQASNADETLPDIYLKAMQIHICLIYFVNGISKMNGTTWHDGSGMWDAINQPQFASILTPLLQRFFMIDTIPMIVCMGTIAIELAYPFLIWIRKINAVILILIILLHVFIALVFGLWLFASVMILFNLVAFGHLLWPQRISEADPST